MKVLFLGIDALDCLLLEQFITDLPNFAALRAQGKQLKVRSTFPPDSDTAWATISTGLNPAQHGIVRFIDPLEKSHQILNVGSPNEILRGKTFWELIGQAGYKVGAVFPHLCYPVWEMPGLMVARGSSVANVQATRPKELQLYPDPEILLGVRGLPDRTLGALQAYASRLERLAQADAEFALRLIQKDNWDVFFVYWSTLDAIGHFFWGYFDPSDPSFVKGHPFQKIIPEAYRLYDQILGRFLSTVDPDTAIIVLSDHGQGARPFNLINVNEVLRHEGFLKAHTSQSHPHLILLEKAKRIAVQVISRYGLGRIAGRIMRGFPQMRQAFTRPASIDWENTLAYATDMSGIKSYSYGGILINRAMLGGRDYESVRGTIIHLLKQTCVLPDGSPLIDLIARREDIYSGPFITRYPDIVLEFKYGYGVGWAINTPLMTQAASYNLVPGSHRGETGTGLIRSSNLIVSDTLDLLDVTPSLLGLLKIKPKQPYSGKNIFAP